MEACEAVQKLINEDCQDKQQLLAAVKKLTEEYNTMEDRRGQAIRLNAVKANFNDHLMKIVAAELESNEEDGVDEDGIDEDGVDEDGVDEDGVDEDGVNENGVNEDGVNEDGVDEDGVNEDVVPKNALEDTQAGEESVCGGISDPGGKLNLLEATLVGYKQIVLRDPANSEWALEAAQGIKKEALAVTADGTAQQEQKGRILAEAASLIFSLKKKKKKENVGVAEEGLATEVDNVSQVSSTGSNRTDQLIQTVMLSTAKLPTFSGNVLEYRSWKEQMQAFCLDLDISAVKKVATVKSTLTGEALSAISHLPVEGDKLPEMIRVLDKRFGKREFVAQAHLKALQALPSLEEKPKQFQKFRDVLKLAVTDLKSWGFKAELSAFHNLQLVASKLPTSWRSKVNKRKKEVTDSDQVFSLQHLLEAIEEKAEEAESDLLLYGGTEKLVTSGGRTGKDERRTVLHTEAESQDSAPYVHPSMACPLHEDKEGIKVHALASCKVFSRMSVDERNEVARKHHRCYKCLGKHNFNKKCFRLKKCEKCNKLGHHTMLHGANAKKKTEVQVKTSGRDSDNDSCCEEDEVQSKSTSVVNAKLSTVPKFVPICLKGPRGPVNTIAFLDDGSETTLLESSVAKQLGLGAADGKKLTVTGIHAKPVTYSSAQVEVEVVSSFGEYKLSNVWVFPLKIKYRHVDWKKEAKKYSHLKGIEVPNFDPDMKVGILIGSDNKKLITPKAAVCGRFDQPVAEQTRLGWVFSGPLRSRKQ